MPALVATIFTFLGAIVTGWHYAVDGYIGIALAQSAYWLALFFEKEPKGPETSPNPREAERGTDHPETRSASVPNKP